MYHVCIYYVFALKLLYCQIGFIAFEIQPNFDTTTRDSANFEIFR